MCIILCQLQAKLILPLLYNNTIHQLGSYTATTGSTSHGSGTSRFMVRVLDSGILAKNALGPCTVKSVLLKSSCKFIMKLRYRFNEFLTDFTDTDEAILPLLVQHICSNSSEEDQQENSVQKGI